MPLLRRPLLSLLIVLLAGGTSVAVMADARGDDDKDPQKKQTAREDGDSLSESVRRIERVTQGQILSAERVQFDGRDVNRVKVVDDRGRVRIYVDDPAKPTESDDDVEGDSRSAAPTHPDDNDDPNL